MIRVGDLIRVKTTELYGYVPIYSGLVLDAVHDDDLDPGVYKILRIGIEDVLWIDAKESSLYILEKIETKGRDNKS